MPRGRPRRYEEEELLDAALQVLWREGVRGVSLNRLAEELGVSKPSIAGTVGCKDELIARALERYRDTYRDAAVAVLAKSESLPVLVRDYLSVFADLQTAEGSPAGCFLASANAECVRVESGPIRQALDRINAESSAELVDALRRLEVKEPESIARFISGQAMAMAAQARMGASRGDLQVFIDLSEHAVTDAVETV